jgi:phosphatidate cytidylyltransferase
MNALHDRQLLWLLGGVLAALVVASLITGVLAARAGAAGPSPTIANLAARVRAWWVMVIVFSLALMTGSTGSVILFALMSFMALREYITLTPVRPADHLTLALAFFVALPFQYVLVAIEWYGMFAIFVPVWAFVGGTVFCAVGGDTGRFLERTSTMQWGLMVCVFFLSHVPALLTLDIPGYNGQNAKLLLFLVLVGQSSDVLQYVWGKLLGRHKLAPVLSPSKTWEGLIGGGLSASALGAALWWATPFKWWQAGLFALIITLMGFFGGLVMSAIKRDRGVKDYGALIEGHGGMMDRIDSLCFSAPVFFHLVRYIYVPLVDARGRRQAAPLRSRNG